MLPAKAAGGNDLGLTRLSITKVDSHFLKVKNHAGGDFTIFDYFDFTNFLKIH